MKFDHYGQSLKHWVLFEAVCWVEINLSVPITRLTCCFPSPFWILSNGFPCFSLVFACTMICSCCVYDITSRALETDCGTGCLYAEHRGAVGEVRGHVVTSCLHMSKCSPIIQHRHALIKSNPIFYQLIPTG